MIKNIFETLTISQKIQLYLLIPMLLWLLSFIFEKSFMSTHHENIKNTTKSINIGKKKIVKSTPSQIVRFLEEKIELYNVSLQTMQIKKRFISIEVLGSLENILSLIKKIETHLEIVSFKLLKDKEILSFSIMINSEYFFNEALKIKEFYSSKNKITFKSPTIKIDAIVGNEVFLEGRWYKTGEVFNGYKLVAVKKEFIQLQNSKTDQILNIELVDEPL